ncbi:hypothetical protein GCM10027414_34510 [Humibacter ginsengiterrae]
MADNDTRADDAPQQIEDWSILTAGRRYELRSGDDRRQGRFLHLLGDDVALFELDGSEVSEPFEQSDWTVYPTP